MTTHHRRCNNRIKHCLSLHLLPFRNFNCNNQFYQLRIRVFSSKQYISQLSLSSPLSCIRHLMDSNKINLKKSSKIYSRKSLKKNKKKTSSKHGLGHGSLSPASKKHGLKEGARAHAPGTWDRASSLSPCPLHGSMDA
jgi:hypothetical protein